MKLLQVWAAPFIGAAALQQAASVQPQDMLVIQHIDVTSPFGAAVPGPGTLELNLPKFRHSEALDNFLQRVSTEEHQVDGPRGLQASQLVCVPEAGILGPYVCFETAVSLDPSLDPLTALYTECEDGSVTTTDKGERCKPFCALLDASDNRCTACTLLESGEIAYDCTNLFPDAQCRARNLEGDCVDFYNHYECFEIGQEGYGCSARDSGGRPNPAFNENDRSAVGSNLGITCRKDMSRRPITNCTGPGEFCSINSLFPNEIGVFEECDSCEVFSNGTFAYDCRNVFPDISCPQLLPDGTCVGVEAEEARDPVPFNFRDQTNVAEDKEYGWGVLTNFPATAFNVMSDLIGYVTGVFAGFAIAAIYPLLLSWQMRRKKHIPLRQLGQQPGDTLQGFSALKALQVSLPAILLLALLILADFSHSMADIGLSFVPVEQKGALDTVLVVDDNNRNKDRPLQFCGDPPFIGTAVTPDLKSDESFGDDPVLHTLALEQQELISRQISTARAFVQGSSPFVVSSSNALVRAFSIAGTEGFETYYTPDDSPIVRMPREIPVECASLEMAKIKESMTAFSNYHEPLTDTASVPNCTLSRLRETGIYYDGDKPSDVEILEHVNGFSDNNAAVDTIQLFRRINGAVETFGNIFDMSAESKVLSRYRDDWKEGRVVVNNEIDGLIISGPEGNLTVDFGRIVLARGGLSTNLELSTSIGTVLQESQDYGLIAEIPGQCPDRPSGLPTSAKTQCLAIVTLACDPFVEDNYFLPPHYSPERAGSECRLSRFRIVWGRNFVADAELISVIASIFALSPPTIVPGDTFHDFAEYCVLAALFLSAKLDTRYNTETVTRPQIDAVYVFFMSFPILVSVALIALAKWQLKNCLGIPMDTWQLMCMSKESILVPSRDMDGNFPDEDPDLALVFFDAHEDLPPGNAESNNRAKTRVVLAKEPPSSGKKKRSSKTRKKSGEKEMNSVLNSNALVEFPVASHEQTGGGSTAREGTVRAPQRTNPPGMVDATMNASSSEDCEEVTTNPNDEEYMC